MIYYETFKKTTKMKSLTTDNGALILPPVGNSFMYIETSFNKHVPIVFCSFKRTDNIQTSNINFIKTGIYYQILI